MIIIKNTQGNHADKVICEKDKIYVHTNIVQDTENPNLYTYDEYQFDINENPTELVSALFEDGQMDILNFVEEQLGVTT